MTTLVLVSLVASSHEATVHALLLGDRLPPRWHRTRSAIMAGLVLDTAAHGLATVALAATGTTLALVSLALFMLHVGYWAFRAIARERFFEAASLREGQARLKWVLVALDTAAHALAVATLIGPSGELAMLIGGGSAIGLYVMRVDVPDGVDVIGEA